MKGSQELFAPAPKHLAQTAGWQQHTARQLENGQKHSQKQSFQGQQPKLPGRMSGLPVKQRHMTQIVYSAYDARMNFLDINGTGLEVRPIAGASDVPPSFSCTRGTGLGQPVDTAWPGLAAGRVHRYGPRGAGLFKARLGQSEPMPDVRHTGRLRPDYMHREAWDVLPALLQKLRIEKLFLSTFRQ